MAQSLAKLYVHLIFSTKHRANFLSSEALRRDTYAYVASALRAHDSPALLVGGAPDHLHALCLLSKTGNVASLIGEVKRSSSKWLKTQGADLASFAWQNGYGAFSVSHSNAGRVQKYILDQEAHHKELSFQDEFRGFLKRHAIEYDERYVWD